jgi:hypothetical protein
VFNLPFFLEIHKSESSRAILSLFDAELQVRRGMIKVIGMKAIQAHNSPSSPGVEPMSLKHCYPSELAKATWEQWDAPCSSDHRVEIIEVDFADPLPPLSTLEDLISICYQTSLLREEERPIRFRLILQEPDRFDPDQGPPKGLHRLIFTKPRPCNEQELRRLSPSTDFYNSLVGVRLDPEEGLLIWGLIHSGARWLQSLHGGGKSFHPLPRSLVLHVTNPGRITICKGSTTVAILNAGQIVCPSPDVFDAQWLQDTFTPARAEVWADHMAERQKAGKPWALIDQDFLRMIRKQVMMRIVSMIRHSHHGGTLICVPEEKVNECFSMPRCIDLKYAFTEEEPRKRFRTLLLDVANALAEAYGGGDEYPEKRVGWPEYLASKNAELSRLDEAIFEWAHLLAGFCAADGAVLLTTQFELLGFGGEISSKLDRVETVRKALDLEGTLTIPEHTGAVGTRHQSAYRLCNTLHDVIAMVVSQDGSVQIIKWKDGALTCWDQVSTSVMDV